MRQDPSDPDDEAEIRAMLIDGVDWTRLARAAIACGLVSLAGHALIRVAPDLVPDDILDAFRATIDQTRQQNLALLDTVLRVIGSLSKAGVEAIPFNGPTLAIDTYGDLGLRRLSGNLDLFIRARDLAPSISCLRGLGYEREGPSTAAQSAPMDGLTVRERTSATPMAVPLRFARDCQQWFRPSISTTEDYGVGSNLRFERPNCATLAPEDALLCWRFEAARRHGGTSGGPATWPL